jgi:hypothetical protein
MYGVFTAVLPAIEAQIKTAAQAYYANISGGSGTMSQVMTIFSTVWSLISGGGIVNPIIDITTQVIPFYFDLFTAHSYAVYPVYGGKIQALPNSPTISQAYPQPILGGRNAVVQGFDFGAAMGKVWVTGKSGSEIQANVLEWSTSRVMFEMPNDEGFGSGDQKTVLVRLEKSDGGTTNTFQAPYRKLDEAEAGGGGGGCSIVASGRGSAPLEWVLLLAIPVVLVRRRRCRV